MTPTRLTLGTVQLGLPYGVANQQGQPSFEQARAIVREAVAVGIRWFDTATAYGDAEARLGEIFRSESFGDIHVVSKLAPLGTRAVAEIRRVVVDGIDASLTRLALPQLDGYLVHDVNDLRVYPDELARALEDAIAAGKIRSAGASVYAPEEASALLEIPVMSVVQLPYNLLDQRARTTGVLAKLSARGFTVFARSAFLQGLLSLDPGALPARVNHARPALAELSRLLARHRLTPMQAALAFVAKTPGIDSVVIGVDRAEQLAANVEAAGLPIPADLGDELAGCFSAIDLAVIEPSRWPQEARA